MTKFLNNPDYLFLQQKLSGFVAPTPNTDFFESNFVSGIVSSLKEKDKKKEVRDYLRKQKLDENVIILLLETGLLDLTKEFKKRLKTDKSMIELTTENVLRWYQAVITFDVFEPAKLYKTLLTVYLSQEELRVKPHHRLGTNFMIGTNCPKFCDKLLSDDFSVSATKKIKPDDLTKDYIIFCNDKLEIDNNTKLLLKKLGVNEFKPNLELEPVPRQIYRLNDKVLFFALFDYSTDIYHSLLNTFPVIKRKPSVVIQLPGVTQEACLQFYLAYSYYYDGLKISKTFPDTQLLSESGSK